ncbi:tRNA 2-selenouridine(34) synthase MnmH [Rubellimicrobium rubrum]|uniref:tRNA 2-selenouridine(34) synthase MnmH n=1 Tax=Rubellimicrobium rubrum TaxID=2585369 RepID=A0A5C4N749_9RHOB|nr:tRNA 2-selenouridine(34) synthase MnmH [Rubellimicrobium rubrum]TNC52871.1 tRNA 2-selenouridine(34) synthase MnmH [Rubellimicrobium rubrum]
MPRAFASVSEFLAHGFDAVIDVRSPSEYAEDHVPGAVSLPVLSDDERARVGTIYVQDSPFRARKLGAALVARNAAAHIEGPLADKGGSWRPLVYCWRGGQRSGSFTTILGQIGWRAEQVEGGYRSWRRLVQRTLYEETLPHRLILLDGLTGTAKTELLHRLAKLGVQVLDLEGLARHRGSLLGGQPGGQPGQKAFETALVAQLAALDPARPVLAEAESSKVGALSLPPALWSAMQAAPRIEITATLDGRARYLAQAYSDLAFDRDRLEPLLHQLVPLRGRATVDRWVALLRDGRFDELAAALMTDHYDPAYRRSRSRHPVAVLQTVDVGPLTGPDLERAAERIAAAVTAG